MMQERLMVEMTDVLMVASLAVGKENDLVA